MEEAEHQEPIDSENQDTNEICPEEILKDFPIEDKNRVKSIVSQTMISGIMKRSNPISEKITSEHITELIKNSNQQDIRDREERKSDKNYQVIFLIIGLLFLGFLIIFLKEEKELLYKIIIAIISFIGGFGIGKTTNNKNKEE